MNDFSREHGGPCPAVFALGGSCGGDWERVPAPCWRPGNLAGASPRHPTPGEMPQGCSPVHPGLSVASCAEAVPWAHSASRGFLSKYSCTFDVSLFGRDLQVHLRHHLPGPCAHIYFTIAYIAFHRFYCFLFCVGQLFGFAFGVLSKKEKKNHPDQHQGAFLTCLVSGVKVCDFVCFACCNTCPFLTLFFFFFFWCYVAIHFPSTIFGRDVPYFVLVVPFWKIS